MGLAKSALPWHASALCRDFPEQLWFGPAGERQAPRTARESEAMAICAVCPVIDACLDHALTWPEREGVWGGTTWPQRREIRRKARAQRAA